MPAVAALPLLLLAGFLVAYGLSVTARRTSHALGAWLIRGLEVIPLIGPTISEAAIQLTRLVTHELGEYAKPAGQAIVRFFAGLGQYAAVVGYWSLLWPKELFTFVWWLLRVHIPRLLQHVPAPVVKVVNGTVKIIRRVETRVVHVTKLIPVAAKAGAIAAVPRWVRSFGREAEWLRRHWKALTAAVAGAGAITLPWGGAGRIERQTKALARRVGRLERIALGAAGVALLVRALSRLKLGWLRCTNVGKVGRRLCGLDRSLLDSLLLDTLAILSVMSVVEFAEDLLAVEDEALKVLQFGVREFPKAVT